MANVNLKKVPKVNLTKNQVVCLTKDGSSNTSNLHKVFFGVNWGAIKTYREEVYTPGVIGKLLGRKPTTKRIVTSVEDVDLDASIILYNDKFSVIDTVYFGSKDSKCKSIHHSGDDLTGDKGDADEDDNETITILLDKVNASAKYLVAILNSYRHHKFDKIPYVGLRIYTGKEGNPDEVLASFKLDNNPEFVGKESIVLGFFHRSDSGWKFAVASGVSTNERSIQEIAEGSAKSLIKNYK